MKAIQRLALALLMPMSAFAQTPVGGSSATASASNPASQAEMRKWIADLDAQWQTAFAGDVTGPFERELERLRQQYLATIDSAMAKAGSAGNLDLAVALRNERERFVSTKEVPAEDDAGTPPGVKQARAAWRTPVARLQKDRAERAKAMHARYDQVLSQAQTQLTQRQRFDDALL